MAKRFSFRVFNKPRYLVLAFALIMLVVGVANYVILIDSQTRIIEHEAVRIAEIATSQAVASRTVYSNAVADKLSRDGFGPHRDFSMHKGMVPLPAQFLKLVGHEASSGSGLYSYGPLSKWNLEPSQGLKEEFQRWAWAQLERQDQADPQGPIDWKPVWRFEKIDGVRTLRYMRADAASTQSCVGCHNALEQTPDIMASRIAAGIAPGKQWKQHQLLGALEARIPVDRIDNIAAAHAKTTLALGLALSLLGFSAAAWLALRERLAAEYFEVQSKFDPLTRLGNRTLFNERGQDVLERARYSGARVGVLFIDLDHFKPINDTLGHHVGDRVLCEVSARFSACLRESDLIVRQGGDEFLMLLDVGNHDHPQFELLAQKLLDALERPIEIDGRELRVSASIGISCYPNHGTDLAELVGKADAAMYQVKRQGRHAYRLWSEDMRGAG